MLVKGTTGRRQAFICTNAGTLLIGPLRTSLSDILIERYIFIQENPFVNAVCEMAAILSRPQSVNTESSKILWQLEYNCCYFQSSCVDRHGRP